MFLVDSNDSLLKENSISFILFMLSTILFLFQVLLKKIFNLSFSWKQKHALKFLIMKK